MVRGYLSSRGLRPLTPQTVLSSRKMETYLACDHRVHPEREYIYNHTLQCGEFAIDYSHTQKLLDHTTFKYAVMRFELLSARQNCRSLLFELEKVPRRNTMYVVLVCYKLPALDWTKTQCCSLLPSTSFAQKYCHPRDERALMHAAERTSAYRNIEYFFHCYRANTCKLHLKSHHKSAPVLRWCTLFLAEATFLSYIYIARIFRSRHLVVYVLYFYSQSGWGRSKSVRCAGYVCESSYTRGVNFQVSLELRHIPSASPTPVFRCFRFKCNFGRRRLFRLEVLYSCSVHNFNLNTCLALSSILHRLDFNYAQFKLPAP